jgi:hypothetical protein
MMLRHLVVLSATLCSGFAFAQAPTAERWAVLTDPVCPVSSFYSPPLPNASKEMRVMYFPAAKGAKLKDSQALTLKIGFNRPESQTGISVPFVRKDDHWEATVPLEKYYAHYVIFSVADEKANLVDDNGGKFWDLVFCWARGDKDVNGIVRQAQSYTGVSWPFGIHRALDYNKAISILETELVADPHQTFVLNDLWNYKVQRDGGDAQAWAKLAPDIRQFMADHLDEQNARQAVGEFVVRNQAKLPADFVEQTISTLDAKAKNPRRSFRASAEYDKAFHEQDPQKQMAAYDAIIAKYPESISSGLAEQGRFYTFIKLGDVPGAESALASYDAAMKKFGSSGSGDYSNYLSLARLYVDKNVKLDEALKLIDKPLEKSAFWATRKVPESIQRSVDLESTDLRARIYIAQHKPEMALREAQKAVKLQFGDSAGTHLLLAQALAATGDKNKALDEYFEAALLPSNKDADYGAELKRYYLRQHFGNARRFDAELEKRKATRFEQSHYVPTLADLSVPEFSFVTLKGEKFEAAALENKTVIVNLWSPG